MHSELRAQLAFRLTGLRREAAGADGARLRPALTARHRRLEELRYDFPLVLAADPAGDEIAVPLTILIDRLAAASPGDAEGHAAQRPLPRLEREMRALFAAGRGGSLHQVWDAAADRLSLTGAPAESLARARKALPFDGDLVDCDAAFPAAFVLQSWKAVQKRKAVRFHAEADRLALRLREILAADDARAPQARSPERLSESVGDLHRNVFDFDRMSRLLGRSQAGRPLVPARRRRIRALLATIDSQRFFLEPAGHGYVFESCGAALKAFRARYADLRSLARALAAASLEARGEYDESRHDALFKQMREAPLSPEEIARFPDYIVCLREGVLDDRGRAELFELLASGIPAKVLLQVDDILANAASPEGLAAVASRADAVTGLALGMDEIFVLQATASCLPRMGAAVLDAIAYPGPALLSVFSGATGESACLPPYLNAAAALESRAFPAFTYDPAKSMQDRSRWSLEANPQPERDWPVHALDFEDREHQRSHAEVAFTVADFLAADARFARHFLELTADGAKAAPVSDLLDRGDAWDDADSPTVTMADEKNRLHDLVADEMVMGLARRGRDRWRRLQRLGVSPVAAVAQAPVAAPQAQAPAAAAPLAASAAAPTAPAAVAVAASAAPSASAVAPAPAPVAPAAAAVPAAVEAAKPASGEPYIETPRCTTCEECMQINKRLFAYDANKQAYIADLSAGTYRDLVEAAESCQVSIIHPGKPRNADEPGLEELLERAAPFL